MPSGLALLPGTSADKVIKLFEDQFGKVRNQSIPCDGGIHTEDLSAELSCDQAFGYRSVVGTCLYLARDRPDLLFTEGVVRVNGETDSDSIAEIEKACGIFENKPRLLCSVGCAHRWTRQMESLG